MYVMFIDISDRNRNIYITRFSLKLPVITPLILDLAHDMFEKFHIVQRSLSQMVRRWSKNKAKCKNESFSYKFVAVCCILNMVDAKNCLTWFEYLSSKTSRNHSVKLHMIYLWSAPLSLYVLFSFMKTSIT